MCWAQCNGIRLTVFNCSVSADTDPLSEIYRTTTDNPSFFVVSFLASTSDTEMTHTGTSWILPCL